MQNGKVIINEIRTKYYETPAATCSEAPLREH